MRDLTGCPNQAKCLLRSLTPTARKWTLHAHPSLGFLVGVANSMTLGGLHLGSGKEAAQPCPTSRWMKWWTRQVSFFSILISVWRPACTFEKAVKLALNSFKRISLLKVNTECSTRELGMKNNEIPTSAITSSSDYHCGAHETWLARLNIVRNGHMGPWSADLNKAGQRLQINLGEERLVTKLNTQGEPSLSPPQWVTSYEILFSSDSAKWEEYKENDVVKVCDGGFLPRGQL